MKGNITKTGLITTFIVVFMILNITYVVFEIRSKTQFREVGIQYKPRIFFAIAAKKDKRGYKLYALAKFSSLYTADNDSKNSIMELYATDTITESKMGDYIFHLDKQQLLNIETDINQQLHSTGGQIQLSVSDLDVSDSTSQKILLQYLTNDVYCYQYIVTNGKLHSLKYSEFTRSNVFSTIVKGFYILGVGLLICGLFLTANKLWSIKVKPKQNEK